MTGQNIKNESELLLGLDVGGTKIDALLVDQDLRVVSQAHVGMNANTPEHTLSSITAAVEAALASAPASKTKHIRAVGLGVPGQVQQGVVRLAVNLGLTDYPLAEALQDRLGTPVWLENDVRTAALGAFQYVSLNGPVTSIAYLSIGTGIAAGIILDGKLHIGANNMAGEIGHIVIDPAGPRCSCGTIGCLEAVASGPAIAQQGVLASQDGQTLLAQYQPITAEAVYQAALAGDPAAQLIVERTSAYLGRAVHGLVMAYDVDKIVIGGGVSHAGELFITPIKAYLARLRSESDLVRRMLPEDKIVLLPHVYSAGAWGAVMLAYATAFGLAGNQLDWKIVREHFMPDWIGSHNMKEVMPPENRPNTL